MKHLPISIVLVSREIVGTVERAVIGSRKNSSPTSSMSTASEVSYFFKKCGMNSINILISLCGAITPDFGIIENSLKFEISKLLKFPSKLLVASLSLNTLKLNFIGTNDVL